MQASFWYAHYVTEALMVTGFTAGTLMVAHGRLRPGRPEAVLIGLTALLGLAVGLLHQMTAMCCGTFYGYPFQWLIQDGNGWRPDLASTVVDVFAWAGAGLVLALLFRLVRPAERGNSGHATEVKRDARSQSGSQLAGLMVAATAAYFETTHLTPFYFYMDLNTPLIVPVVGLTVAILALALPALPRMSWQSSAMAACGLVAAAAALYLRPLRVSQLLYGTPEPGNGNLACCAATITTVFREIAPYLIGSALAMLVLSVVKHRRVVAARVRSRSSMSQNVALGETHPPRS